MNLTETDIINLTNKAKREAVLKAWREWPVWVSVPEIGLTVRRLDLPGGKAFTAAWYEGDEFIRPGCCRIVHEPNLHLIGHDGKLASGTQGWSVMVEELQALRKQLLEGQK